MPLATALIALVTLTPQQRQLNLESFDKVWITIRDQHWDPKLGGLDWQAVRDELRPQMERAASMEKARAVLASMIDRLRQSHFNIVPGDVYKDLDQKGGADSEEGWAGIDVRVIDARALVTTVEKATPAWERGVRPGWQIVRIDGVELGPILAKVDETYKNSTMREIMLARFVLAKLSGSLGAKVRLRFLDGHDQSVELDLMPVKPKGIRSQFGYLPVKYVWLESRRLDGNIGHIVFNIFLAPGSLMKEFEDAVKSCLRCDGMVVDLRGNPGGIGAMAMGMAGWFLDKPNQRLGTMYMRQAPLHFVVNPRLETYRGPLAILVDGNSASTSEILAGGMKDLGRARVFGSRTAGAALPSVFERLPNGDGFQYAIANYISEGGKPLEGAGVVPHVAIALTREALLAGRDPALEAAVEWIRKTKETK